MGLFNFRSKDKPDIPKDAPKKKGIMLVLSTLWREFFNILKLNLVFILAALPVVTLPAALKAMSRISIKMVQDENFFLWRDFWKAFKDDFWKSFFGGLIFLFIFAAFTFSIIFYSYYGREMHWLLLGLAAFAIALLIWAYVASLYFFLMNAYVNLRFIDLLKNSIFLVFQGWKRSGLAFLSTLLFLAAPILLLPYSAVFVLFVSFPLTNLLVAFALYPVLEQKTILLEQEAEETETIDQNSGDQYLHSATFTGWEDEEKTTETEEKAPETEEKGE